MFQKKCNQCDGNGLLMRVRRTFIEKLFKYKKCYKLKCNYCEQLSSIELGSNQINQ